MTKLVFIDEIDFERSPKVRHQLNDDTIDSYAESYRSKKKLPPIHVFADKDDKLLIADGWHRCYAKTQLGQKGIDAEVHKGGYEECLKFALTANTDHGLPRSHADKRKCIKLAIVQWPQESNAIIARTVDVDDKTVKDVREELEKAEMVPKFEKRRSAKGTLMPATRSPRKSEEKAATPPPVVVPSAVDANGVEIPKAIIKYWNRTPEVKGMISEVTDMMRRLKEIADEEDPMYQSVNLSAALGDLENLRKNIGLAIPYCVCPQCHGHPEIQPKEECRLCGQKGLISKFIWDRAIPEETKAMIAKKK